MNNLLQETIDKLKNNKLTPADVEWIGTKDGKYHTGWDNFALLADMFYDDGYGGVEVRLDLVVVGKGWWLERHEYDGSEWWEFKRIPTINAKSKTLKRLWVISEYNAVYTPDEYRKMHG